MKKKILFAFIIITSILLINDIIFLVINRDVNYEELRKDIKSIKNNNTIKYAKNSKNSKKYKGKGYTIIKSKGQIKTNYKAYISKRMIWKYDKFETK